MFVEVLLSFLGLKFKENARPQTVKQIVAKILRKALKIIHLENCSVLGPIHTRHLDAQYCDIAIKRYFSTNIFFHRVN